MAKNLKGYQELIQLSTRYQFNEKSSLPLEEVIKRSDDLFVISPGDNGEIVSLLQHNRLDEAEDVLKAFIKKMKRY